MRRDSLTIEEKPDCLWVFALSITEGVHQLLEFRTPLYLEEDLIVVICDLDVKVFGALWLLLCTIWRLVLVSHGDCAKGCDDVRARLNRSGVLRLEVVRFAIDLSGDEGIWMR